MNAPLPRLGTIKIRLDRVYGKVTIYPACERSKLLAEIAGTKTLTNGVLALAERMGFEIVESASASALIAAREHNAAIVKRGPPGGSSDPFSKFYRGSDFS